MRAHGRVVWLSHSAWLRSHRSVTLSRITRFSRTTPRIVAFTPTIVVNLLQYGCTVGAFGNTHDSIAWTEYYTPSGSPFSDMETCQLNDGKPILSHTEAPTPSCVQIIVTVGHSPCEIAHFLDGEAIIIANVPDDNGSGGSNANASPYTFYNQGFSCGAVAGVGSGDNSVYRAKTNDSIEFFQNYVDYNGTRRRRSRRAAWACCRAA